MAVMARCRCGHLRATHLRESMDCRYYGCEDCAEFRPLPVSEDPVRRRFCKTCAFYTDHVATAHDGLAARGLLLPREDPA